MVIVCLMQVVRSSEDLQAQLVIWCLAVKFSMVDLLSESMDYGLGSQRVGGQ
jgi:hypothetical protein